MSIIAAAAAGASARVRVTVGVGVPSVPQNLSATAASASQINLTWDASTGSPTHYNIYRDEPETPTLVPTQRLIATSATNSFNDTGLQGLTRYEYQVSAENAAGESALSTADTADTSAPANTIWVSPLGGGNGSSQESPTTLATANADVQAGDMVAMLSGTYATQIRPAATPASEGQRITYKAVPANTPILSASTFPGDQAVNLSSRSYITVDGIIMDGVNFDVDALIHTAVMMTDSHHNIIRNCTIVNCIKNGIALYDVTGLNTYNKILNNYIDWIGSLHRVGGSDVGEGIDLEYSQYGLVDGNTMRHGGHNLINVNNPNDLLPDRPDFNVIRNNDLNNDWDDVFPGEGNRAGQYQNCTGGVFEGNRITGTRTNTEADIAIQTGFKFEGDRHIVRNNILFDNDAHGFRCVIRPPVSPFTKNCRCYHNTFRGHVAPAWEIDARQSTTDPSGEESAGNEFKNNAVFDTDAEDVSIVMRTPDSNGNNDNRIVNNIFGPDAGSVRVQTNESNVVQSVAAWDGAFGGEILDNTSAASFGWVGGAAPTTLAGFAPDTGSPLIDAADWLTVTVGTDTNGTTMVVADAKYFFDGYGIPGVLGDLIQLEGQTVTSRITAVNYATNTLTLDTPLTWTSGLGVALPYSGTAPDLGAVQT